MNDIAWPAARRSALTAATTLLLLTPSVLWVGGDAAATTTTTTIVLPFEEAQLRGDIVATSDRVYVAEGPNGDTILAFNLQGDQVGALTGLPGPMGMVVHQGTLYVTLAQDASIAAYDATTLTLLRRMSLAPFTLPWFLSRVGDRLFFGHDCFSDSPRMGSIRLDGSKLTTYPSKKGDRTTYPWYCPMFAPNPADHKSFVAVDSGLSPALLLSYSVQNPQGAVRLERQGYYIAETLDPTSMEDMAITPDGRSLIAAVGPPWLAIFDLATFGPDRAVPTSTYPLEQSAIAIDIVPDGSRIAGGADDTPDAAIPPRADVYVFDSGNSTPVFTYDLGSGAGARLWPRGVAISPDGQHVFALSGRFESTSYLHVFDLGA